MKLRTLCNAANGLPLSAVAFDGGGYDLGGSTGDRCMSFRKIHFELCNYILRGGTRTLIIEGWRMKVGGPSSLQLGVDETMGVRNRGSCCRW